MAERNYTNNNSPPPSRYLGIFWTSLLIGMTYASLTSCKHISRDIKDRQEYISNQESIRTNYWGGK